MSTDNRTPDGRGEAAPSPENAQKTPPGSVKRRRERREDRLAAALRANLKRRKTAKTKESD